MRNVLVLAAALCAAAACAKPAGPPSVQALDPWCRPAPEGAMTAACYVTLTASTDDLLVSAATPVADHAEVHSMDMTGGVMRMAALKDGLKLPRNKAVALTPGSEHLMLISPKETLSAGKSVSLTFTFAKAPPMTVTAPVRPAPLPGG